MLREPARRDILDATRSAPVAGAAEPDVGHEPRLWRAAVLVIGIAGVVRLVLAAAAPLVPDEAYYWEWSRRLAAGYFDHPPVIALLVRAGTAIFGATPLGVRFVPVLAGVATMLLVAGLARRHGGDRAALYAALVSACVPLAAAGLVLATPDTPLLLAYALGLSAVDRALAARRGSASSYRWWALGGAALGLGLASKYTAVLLPLGVLLAMLARPSLRRWLRTPEPYVATLIALLVFAPVVAWNARHDWVSFRFQLQHGLGSSVAGAPGRVLDLFTNQLVLVSPILFVLLALATVRALRRSTGERRFVVAAVAVSTFAVFVYSALTQRPEPNWPAPAYVPGFVLLALAVAGPAWKRWVYAGSALGALMIVLIYVQVLHPVLPIPPREDPLARGYGWAELADTVHAASARTEARDGTVWIAANRYQDAAQLAFHLPGTPVVFSLNLRSRPNQYDHWAGFPDRARPGHSLVLALETGAPGDAVIRILRPHFAEVRTGARVEMRRAGRPIANRRVWVLEGWQGGWPGRSSVSVRQSHPATPTDVSVGVVARD